jgi:hypothetical protein
VSERYKVVAFDLIDPNHTSNKQEDKNNKTIENIESEAPPLMKGNTLKEIKTNKGSGGNHIRKISKFSYSQGIGNSSVVKN